MRKIPDPFYGGPDPLAVGPDEAARRLSVSTRAIYFYIKDGTLKSYKDGRRRLIPTAEIQSYFNRKVREASS